jgi:thioredoxin-like negative regulator of GroEL
VISIVNELQLTDFDADHQLLALPGTTLLIFTSAGCASCRWARQQLPHFDLAVTRLAWIDAGDNPGVTARYEVFHLPALFVIKDGYFYAALSARLERSALTVALEQALKRPAEELP